MASNPLLVPKANQSLLTGKETGTSRETSPAPTTSSVNDVLKTGAQLLNTASPRQSSPRGTGGRNRNLAEHDPERRNSGVDEGYPEAPYNQPSGGSGGGEPAGPAYPTGGAAPPTGNAGGANVPTSPGQFWSDRVQRALNGMTPAARQAAIQSWQGNPDVAEAWYDNAVAAGALNWTQNDWSQEAAPDTYSQRDWSGHPNAAQFDQQYQRLLSMGIPPGRAHRIVAIALGGMEHDWNQYKGVPLDLNDGWGSVEDRVNRFLEGDKYYDSSCPVDAPYKSQHGGTGCVEKPWDVAADSPGAGGGGGGGTGGGGGGGGRGGGGGGRNQEQTGRVQERPEYTPNAPYTTADRVTGNPGGHPAPTAVGGPSPGGVGAGQPGQSNMDPRVVQAYMQGLNQNPAQQKRVDIASKAIPGGSTVNTPLFRTGM